MAPEWIFNLPITSKVDVYSYGMVVLEMMTGKSPSQGGHACDGKKETEYKMLAKWVKDKRNGASARCWLKEITYPILGMDYDEKKMEILIEVALKCVEECEDDRPSMSQVVKMILQDENNH